VDSPCLPGVIGVCGTGYDSRVSSIAFVKTDEMLPIQCEQSSIFLGSETQYLLIRDALVRISSFK
jgi:hypothetical protein